MKFKSRYFILTTLTFFYINTAVASIAHSTYLGEIWGLNGETNTISVTFSYDSSSGAMSSASASVGGVSGYTGNYFQLASQSEQYMYFSAPTIAGDTMQHLNLYGDFFSSSPADFEFDNRSSVNTTSPWSKTFDIRMDNSSVITSGTISPVPVPAAAWLFGSGLVGLAGFARRKKA